MKRITSMRFFCSKHHALLRFFRFDEELFLWQCNYIDFHMKKLSMPFFSSFGWLCLSFHWHPVLSFCLLAAVELFQIHKKKSNNFRGGK